VVEVTLINEPSEYEAMYHSNYDSYEWMSQFGDRGFVYHKAMAQFFGGAVMRLADSTILPLNVTDYAQSIEGWCAEYSNDVNNSFADFRFLTDKSQRLNFAAERYQRRVAALQAALDATPATVSPYEVRAVNDIAMGMERVFLASGAKETGQEWYKHVLFTPSTTNSYAATVMPLIGNALATKDPQAANFALGRVAQFIGRAAWFVNSSTVSP
jgi:N-acetylated-alpha-linked acidic dipeptidase